MLSIDVEATILSELDKDGFEEAKLRDADRILHQYLLPMGYPWSEDQPYSGLIKTFPRDIDEMPEILGIEDDRHVPYESGPFGYGKFEVGKTMKSPADPQGGVKAATRRSEGTGVIELTAIESDEDEEIQAVPAAASTVTSSSQINGITKRDRREEVTPRRSARKRRSSHTSGDVRDSETMEEIQPRYMMNYYRRVQEVKRQKHGVAISKTKKKFVSVRFGGVSSRKSIFPDETLNDIGDGFGCKQVPLLVKVHLPHEVQGGRNLILTTAAETSSKLGSYDMRYGMPNEKPSKTSNRSKRTTTGRTRLMWTKAHLGAGTSIESNSSRHRLAYSALLTANRVDIAQFRRPREAVLAVRVNGVRLGYQNQNIPFSPRSVLDRPNGSEDETVAAASGISDKAVSAAITAACGTASTAKKRRVSRAPPQPQPAQTQSINTPSQGQPICFLQTEELLQKLLRARKATVAAAKRAAKVLETVGGEQIRNLNNTDFALPILDCLPSTDGLVRVVCTAPGRMKPRQVPAVLELEAGTQQSTNCTVCFAGEFSEVVERCVTCGVRVHLSCCADKGTRPADKNSWMCSCCSEINRDAVFSEQASNSAGRRRKSKAPLRFRDGNEEDPVVEIDLKPSVSCMQCQLCLHSGGAMSPSLENGGYIHEVCRVWTGMPVQLETDSDMLQDLANNPLLNRIRNICALCGSRTQDRSNELTRCAASGCRVLFHPMCALLGSKIATSEARGEMPSDKLERMKILDSQLCKQYTLTMMKCTTMDSNGEENTTIRPVAFCGLHNPIRETSLYGCYPCGGLVGDAMRIPSVSL